MLVLLSGGFRHPPTSTKRYLVKIAQSDVYPLMQNRFVELPFVDSIEKIMRKVELARIVLRAVHSGRLSIGATRGLVYNLDAETPTADT